MNIKIYEDANNEVFLSKKAKILKSIKFTSLKALLISMPIGFIFFHFEILSLLWALAFMSAPLIILSLFCILSMLPNKTYWKITEKRISMSDGYFLRWKDVKSVRSKPFQGKENVKILVFDKNENCKSLVTKHGNWLKELEFFLKGKNVDFMIDNDSK